MAGRVAITEKTGTKTTDFANTVVYLESAAASSKPKLKSPIAMANRTFAPHVRVVTVGSTVEFPNQDPFSHNVFSTTAGALFDLGSYGNGKSRSHEFKKTGAFPVYCNVHLKMVAYVIVVNTMWHAQAGNDGRWEIAGVPSGRYTMTVWHERSAPVVSEIEVPATGLAAVETKLDATGYRLVQHKDKIGKDYSTHATVY